MQFKEWLNLQEMAFLSKRPVVLDQYDMEYLSQFPRLAHARALSYRYGEFLKKALDEKGEIRPDWQDTQTIEVPISRGVKILTIKFNIPQVVQKLKDAGYQLHNNLAYFNNGQGLTLRTAQQLVYLWRKDDPNQPDYGPRALLKPGLSFYPNERLRIRNDEVGEEENWEKHDYTFSKYELEEIDDDIKAAIEALRQYVISTQTPNINARYWSNNPAEAYEDLRNYVMQNKLTPEMRDRTKRRKKLYYYLAAIKTQGGLIPRRLREDWKKNGVNLDALPTQINPFTGKNWTLNEIKSVFNVKLTTFASQTNPFTGKQWTVAEIQQLFSNYMPDALASMFKVAV